MKRITLLLTALLTLIAVAQKNSFRMDVFLNDGTKRSYDLSSVKYVTIQEIGDKIAPNGDTIRMVDLNLPSGTLWADRNIGAKNLTDVGIYYSWGEILPKTEYTLKNYDFKTKLWNINDTQNDAVRMTWGYDYSLPDSTQCAELCDTRFTQWKAVTKKDSKGKIIRGHIVKSKTNNDSIFLPETGYKSGTTIYSFPTEYSGRYWSATRGGRGAHSQQATESWTLSILKNNPYMHFWRQDNGLPIRPTLKKKQ